MLAALLLAGICAEVPLFDLDGPVCAPERLAVECGCSECMKWDPEPLAASYEVNRETVSSGTFLTVGTLSEQSYVDQDGAPALIPPATLWCFARDSSFPHEGVQYRYRVRACNTLGCGPWSDPQIVYVAAPYACFDAGREIPCYVADAVVTR